MSREKKSAEKRKSLLDAAEGVYYREGDLGLTVRRIAAEASTTSQTIYTYFGSRDAVIDAMLFRTLDELDRVLGAMARSASSSSGLDDGRRRAAVMGPYRQHCVNRPAHLKMMALGFGPEGAGTEELAKRRAEILSHLEPATVADRPLAAPGIDPAPPVGSPTVAPAGSPAALVLAAIHGFIQAEIHDQLDEGQGHSADGLFRHLLDALS